MIMKKYFIFAAIATASLFASCSSSDDAISEAPVNPIQETDLVPIKIGVTQPTASVTRGTGTVGGVVDGTNAAVKNDGTAGGAANVWKGQKVKVYMFDHGTLNVATFQNVGGATETLFENAELTTPAAAATGIADYLVPTGQLQDQNTPERYVKYYPMSGNFDFWGYRVDDATATAPAIDGDGDLATTIEVDGTQDVLSGVANIPASYTTIPDPSNLKDAVDAYGASLNPALAGEEAFTAYKANRLYSASAARKNVQPELMFGHMMTRLTFDAYAGSDNAKKVTNGDGVDNNFDPDNGDVYNGVYVTGITVRAIEAIDNTDPNAPEITYDDPTAGTFKIAGIGANFKPSLTWGTTTQEPAAFVLKKRDVNATTPENAPLIDLIDANVTKVVGTQNVADYDKNGAILLWETATDGTVKKEVGEAIIAPSAAAYEITINLCQTVVKTETLAGVAVTYETKQFNTIKNVYRPSFDATNDATRFQPGTSYNFSIKVYGLEKIDITTTLKPWVFGENINIDTDN